MGDPNDKLIDYVPKLILVNWVQLKGSCIIQCLIWDFTFTIEWIIIFTCILNYDVHVMACPHKSRRSFQCSLLIHWAKCKLLIVINKCSDKYSEDIKRHNGKPKGFEISEHIPTKVKVNPLMLSTLKIEKSIWGINPEECFETPMVRPLGI